MNTAERAPDLTIRRWSSPSDGAHQDGVVTGRGSGDHP